MKINKYFLPQFSSLSKMSSLIWFINIKDSNIKSEFKLLRFDLYIIKLQLTNLNKKIIVRRLND